MAAKKKINTSKKTSKGEPRTMDDLLALYTQSVKVFSRGDRVKGKVVEKRPDALVVDIGGKSEALVKGSAFDESRGFIKNIEIGDEVEARVIVSETPDGFTILSLRQAAADANWDKIKKAKDKKKAIKVMGKSVSSSGILVEVDGLIGFIPSSHMGKKTTKKINNLVGKRFKAKVIEVDRDANKIVLSERAVSEGEEIELAEKAIKNVKEGEIFEGKVITVVDFGCFVQVQLKVGKKTIPVEGLVHVSEMGWEKVEKPSDMVKEGDKVKVKVIGTEPGKLALSMKQAGEDPWEKVEKKYGVDAKVKGKISKMTDFGAFVSIEPGIEGLIHITKIPPDRKLRKGDEVNAYVEDVDKKNHRLSLGLVLTAKPVGYK